MESETREDFSTPPPAPSKNVYSVELNSYECVNNHMHLSLLVQNCFPYDNIIFSKIIYAR